MMTNTAMMNDFLVYLNEQRDRYFEDVKAFQEFMQKLLIK